MLTRWNAGEMQKERVLKSEKEFGMNAKLLHARNQCSPIDCHTRGSSVCASNTTLCLAQNTHNLLSLCLLMLFSYASRVSLADFADRLSYNSGNLVLHAVVFRRVGVRIRFAQFLDRHFKRFATRENYGPLDEILQFPNVSRPLTVSQGLHRGGWNRFDAFLQSPCELLDEE